MNVYDFAVQTTREAGAKLLELREEGFKTMEKDGNPRDIVTSTDLAVNDVIIERIRDAFPDDSIFSEESDDIKLSKERAWVIDPIDGSANFSRNIPHFAVCLGLLEGGVPTVGAVFNPVTNELFSFEKGKGAFLNEQPIQVSAVSSLQEATVFLHGGRKKENWDWGGASYRKLLEHARKVKNFGSSSLDISFVAAGRIEACISGALTTLDVAPALGLLKEAGGVASDALGAPLSYSQTPQKVFVANNEALLTQVRTLLEQ